MKQRFIHAFCKVGTKTVNQYGEPDVISLQRFLLAFVIARPSSSLNLPGLILKDLSFKLNEDEKAQVTESTLKYQKARCALSDPDYIVTRTGMIGPTIDAAALAYAVLAQLEASHNVIAAYSKSSGLDQVNAAELDASIDDSMAYLVDRHTLEPRRGLPGYGQQHLRIKSLNPP
jgi:hypothetical protein